MLHAALLARVRRAASALLWLRGCHHSLALLVLQRLAHRALRHWAAHGSCARLRNPLAMPHLRQQVCHRGTLAAQLLHLHSLLRATQVRWHAWATAVHAFLLSYSVRLKLWASLLQARNSAPVHRCTARRPSCHLACNSRCGADVDGTGGGRRAQSADWCRSRP